MDNICPCGKLGTQKCKKCNSKNYCSDSCAKSNWRRHKKHCIDSITPDCSNPTKPCIDSITPDCSNPTKPCIDVIKPDWSKFPKCYIIHSEVDTVVTSFYSANLGGCCLPSSLILAARLRKKGVDAQLKDGYVLYDNGYSMRHVWLELANGDIIDAGKLISLQYYPRVYVGHKYVESFPEGSYRIDYETKEEKENMELFERAIKLIRELGEDSYWQRPDVPYTLRRIYKQLLTDC
jgi:hypothetical protein